MDSWIYLKNSVTDTGDFKAAALATVLKESSGHFNVVHTRTVSRYVRGLNNVHIGYPVSGNSEIITLDLPDNLPYYSLCKSISMSLGLQSKSNYTPYLGFAVGENEVDRQLSKMDNIILFNLPNQDIPYLHLETVVCRLKAQSYSSVCFGESTFIRGAYDFRGLIQIEELIRNKNKIKVLVTSVPMTKEIGLLLHIPVIYIDSESPVVYSENKSEIVDIITDLL